VRRLAAALALVLVSFAFAQAQLYRSVDRVLDSDGQVVRAVDLALARAGEDPRFADFPGLPAYVVSPGSVAAVASPYPPGLPTLWAPVLAVLPPTEAVVRATSVAFALLGLLATAALGHALGGPTAAWVAAVVAAGSPALGGFAAGASVDVVVGGLAAAAGAAVVRGEGWTARGSGWTVGLALVAVLLVKWSGVLVAVPLLAASGLALGRRSAIAARGMLALGGMALVLAVGLVGAVLTWWPAPPWALVTTAPALAALALAAWARVREPALARASLSAALVFGPGLAWYWASIPILRAYRAVQAGQVERAGFGEGAMWVLPILLATTPLFVPAALAAPLLTRRLRSAAPVVAVVLGVLGAAFGLGASGDGGMFANGSVAGRLLLGLLPFAAASVGVAVAGLVEVRPGWGRVLAAAVGVYGLAGTWAFALAPCPGLDRSGGVVERCHPILPRWSAVPARGRPLEPLLEALPPTQSWRFTLLRVGANARLASDERVFLAGLAHHRVLQIEPLDRGRAQGWWEAPAGAFDDLVGIGLPSPPAELGATPLRPAGLPPGFLIPARTPLPARAPSQ